MARRGIESAKAKLVRAKKHLKAIKRCIADYSASRPYKLTKPKGKKTTKLTIPKSPPRQIAILAGEMVYQMRSALDHLVFDLVKQNASVAGGNSKWFENCEFPLRINLKPGQKPPLPHDAFGGLPGISKSAFAFIESVQPYYGNAAVNNALGYLGKLSNIDKHRHLNVVRGRVRKFQTIRYASGMRSRGFQAVDHGAEIPPETGRDESDRAVNVQRSFQAFVTFKERDVFGDATALPLDYLLQLILEQIQTIIVPAFEKMI